MTVRSGVPVMGLRWPTAAAAEAKSRCRLVVAWERESAGRDNVLEPLCRGDEQGRREATRNRAEEDTGGARSSRVPIAKLKKRFVSAITDGADECLCRS
jgi:hypothetical protein